LYSDVRCKIYVELEENAKSNEDKLEEMSKEIEARGGISRPFAMNLMKGTYVC